MLDKFYYKDAIEELLNKLFVKHGSVVIERQGGLFHYIKVKQKLSGEEIKDMPGIKEFINFLGMRYGEVTIKVARGDIKVGEIETRHNAKDFLCKEDDNAS